ncbi:MAG TPA: hypothetical protein VFE72_01230 [Lysobacter sp.]|nr:hypothetical protein [Lysobacter sp.]
MSRKLRNNLNALMVTAALCATGAFAVAATPFAASPVRDASTVEATAAVAAEAGVAKPPRTSRIRHALAMPYFSFLPRG